MNIKDYLLLFIPAMLIVCIGLFVRVIQYEPLFPEDTEENDQETTLATVPIFADDIITGNKQSPVSIVIFEDVSCSQCKLQSEMLDQLAKRYPSGFHVIWKLLPVTSFPQSTRLAHTYAYCANQQGKFTEFKALVHENSTNLSDTMLQLLAEDVGLNAKALASCLASEEATAYQGKVESLAGALHIQAVPAIFVNDSQIPSPQTIADWETQIGK